MREVSLAKPGGTAPQRDGQGGRGGNGQPHMSRNKSSARCPGLSKVGLSHPVPLADPGHLWASVRQAGEGVYTPRLSSTRATPQVAPENSRCSCTPRRPSPSPSGSRTVWDSELRCQRGCTSWVPTLMPTLLSTPHRTPKPCLGVAMPGLGPACPQLG